MTARFALAAALAGLASALAAEQGKAPVAPAPELPPGRETRVDEPKVGGGYFTVYVPSDYRASRRWPAIFCYHGQGGKQTVWPFREVTGGKGFIVVGMSYLDQSPRRLTTAEFDQQMAREAECVATALARVASRLAVDREQLFVGGFSMGGWMASSMAEACPELW
ncbi:MAG TPA: alpha/beta hydrolase-fold protein, partial [Planctomycetota bacterium]|nr:alpha/beta hydrolase-fold protein [Planctomycetota bacterium]